MAGFMTFLTPTAASSYFPGRLTAEAETAICEVFWNWVKSQARIHDANPSRTWWFEGSENHTAMRRTTGWHGAKILKDVAPYNTYIYDDGSTAAEQYAAWVEFHKEYLRERAQRGLLVEIGSTTYVKYSLQGWYNFYDFWANPE